MFIGLECAPPPGSQMPPSTSTPARSSGQAKSSRQCRVGWNSNSRRGAASLNALHQNRNDSSPVFGCFG